VLPIRYVEYASEALPVVAVLILETKTDPLLTPAAAGA
jgi:hypothetical protein